MIVVKPIEGKTLRCSTRSHAVTTDRKSEDGGSDAGCTSGELLLMAIGSCAMGSLRNALSQYRLSADEIAVEVDLMQADPPAERDDIRITVRLAERALAEGAAEIARVATSGGVVSRVRLGSVVHVDAEPLRMSET